MYTNSKLAFSSAAIATVLNGSQIDINFLMFDHFPVA